MNSGLLIENFDTLSDALDSLNPSDIGIRKYQHRVDYDQNYIGYQQTAEWAILSQEVFSKYTVEKIQQKVSEYLMGVSNTGKIIVPSETVVVNALNGVFRTHIPRTGDIYGRYLVHDNTSNSGDYAYIVDKTISLLVTTIKNDIEMEQNNYKLNIWDSVLLGDDNPQGLRQYAPIKLREKGPDRFLFNMRY